MASSTFIMTEDPHLNAIKRAWKPTDELVHQFSLYMDVKILYKIISQIKFVKSSEISGLEKFFNAKSKQQQETKDELQFQDLLLLGIICDKGAGTTKNELVASQYFKESIATAEAEKAKPKSDKIEIADQCIVVSSFYLTTFYSKKGEDDLSTLYDDKALAITKKYPTSAYYHYFRMFHLTENRPNVDLKVFRESEKNRLIKAYLAAKEAMARGFNILWQLAECYDEESQKITILEEAALKGSLHALEMLAENLLPMRLRAKLEDSEDEGEFKPLILPGEHLSFDNSGLIKDSDDEDEHDFFQFPQSFYRVKEIKSTEKIKLALRKDRVSNDSPAYKYFEFLANEHNCAEAMFYLGEINYDNSDIPDNLASAKEYYKRAALAGHTQSLDRLKFNKDGLDTWHALSEVYYTLSKLEDLHTLYKNHPDNEIVIFFAGIALSQVVVESGISPLKAFLKLATENPKKFCELAETVSDETKKNILVLLGKETLYNNIQEFIVASLQPYLPLNVIGIITNKFGLFQTTLNHPKIEEPAVYPLATQVFHKTARSLT